MGNAGGKQRTSTEQEEELPPDVEEQLNSGDNMLDLSFKKLKFLPTSLCRFSHLEKLYISNNRLRELPPEFHELENLRILALDFNKLEDVPSVVCHMGHITRLYLGSNRLMSLPAEFRNLQNLRCLWMENNYFQMFPKQLFDLPNLKSLQMGDNRLKTLPEDLTRMSSLRGLWLYGNRFEEFPRILMKMEYLEIIDVDRNKISQFPNLSHLHQLKLFSYDHNPAKVTPKVCDTCIPVGNGAEEVLAVRAQIKEEAETAADGAEGDVRQECVPVIHGILKNGNSFSGAAEESTKNSITAFEEPGEEEEEAEEEEVLETEELEGEGEEEEEDAQQS
ncbi:leucine-rich repeat-containing protein 10B [Erpetoichthys calabaricus]|uniref:leucine-rich repeat-containing protein 10B n=1 Tax=Erpetoichthys calabaricus TaxID=27687 RepID=UPI00109F8250|nr:leucine-rich repeat-containing protein 10B [Erpetoichthys calabaricus]